MPIAYVNGIDIYWELHTPHEGQGGSPRQRRAAVPLVLSHGFAGPAQHWLPELVPLARIRPLFLYDVRGHGRTQAPPDPADYSMHIFASDLADVMKAAGIERAHVGGESMGGMITAQFAVDYPEMCESVLILDSTCGNGANAGDAGNWERMVQFGIRMLADSVQKIGLKETLLREHEWKLKNDPHLAESPYSLEDDLERIKLMTPEGHVGAANAILTRPDLTNRVPEIAAPTLIMGGEWDGFLPCAQRDHKLIANSRFVLRRRCAHGSRWRAETFISEIESFLDDVEGERPIAGQREV